MLLDRRLLCALAALSLAAATDGAAADIVEVTQVGTAGAFITFDSSLTGSNAGTFQGGGFSPSPTTNGRLDSDSWATVATTGAQVNFGGTNTGGQFARGTNLSPENGTPQNSGIWAFDVNNASGQANWALGVKPGNNTFAPGSVYLRVQNGTGLTSNTWGVSFDLYNRNNQDRSSMMSLAYAVAPITVVDPTLLTYVATGLSFTSPTTSTGTTNWSLAGDFSTQLALAVPDGEALYLRWMYSDVTTTGSNLRDGFAIDNIRVSIQSAAVPEPSSLILTGLAAVIGGAATLRRRRKPPRANG